MAKHTGSFNGSFNNRTLRIENGNSDRRASKIHPTIVPFVRTGMTSPHSIDQRLGDMDTLGDESSDRIIFQWSKIKRIALFPLSMRHKSRQDGTDSGDLINIFDQIFKGFVTLLLGVQSSLWKQRQQFTQQIQSLTIQTRRQQHWNQVASQLVVDQLDIVQILQHEWFLLTQLLAFEFTDNFLLGVLKDMFRRPIRLGKYDDHWNVQMHTELKVIQCHVGHGRALTGIDKDQRVIAHSTRQTRHGRL
mmetsp:Transcript_31388/g.52395  ORF Transcript_31388/g.52395 Transcript_31388/m.52395 type:complete len:247 (+) Transcript_31388:274-1014(+)